MHLPHLALQFCIAVGCMVFVGACPLQATYQYQFEVFTHDGEYHNSPALNMYMVVSDGTGQADFTFYNTSSIQSCVARIYFDDGSLLGISQVENGPGTIFNEIYPGPGNLPSGETIGFYADREFSIGAVAPPPKNGVNPPPPDEWVKVHFNLKPGGTLEGVIGELNSGELRVGIHIIDLPDGSSESAVGVPEPTAIALLIFGSIAATKRHRA